jgi:FtsP/CotA-like multicopper oxidase with cupredoxin domain
MAPTVDTQPESKSLEDELQGLALEENELDDRTSSLELKTILIAMLAGTALIFSVAALAVALIRTGSNGNGTGSSAATPAAAAPTTGGTAMSGMGAMNMALPMKNVKLTIKADTKRGSDGKTHDAFFPTTDLTVKSGQRVRVTIYNYDDMPHSFTSPGLAKGAAIPAGEEQTQGTPQDIKVMPAPGIGVDQMIPPASGNKPSMTVLTFTAPAKAGSYIWYCKLPCDAWAMSHNGYMVGRVKVTPA